MSLSEHRPCMEKSLVQSRSAKGSGAGILASQNKLHCAVNMVYYASVYHPLCVFIASHTRCTSTISLWSPYMYDYNHHLYGTLYQPCVYSHVYQCYRTTVNIVTVVINRS